MIYHRLCPLFRSFLLDGELTYEQMCCNPKYKKQINRENTEYFDCG